MVDIKERTKLGRIEDGRIFNSDPEEEVYVDEMSPVSMNFWGFHPSIFGLTEKYFAEFLADNKDKPKAEFFIPIIASRFIEEEGGVIKVIPTSSEWFGVTYKEDAPTVKSRLDSLIGKDAYPKSLWNI